MNEQSPAVVDSPDEARRMVRKMRKYGAEVIKICATGGVFSRGSSPGAQQMTLAEMQAVVEEARAALDEIIRVLALQDIPPSQALAFVFHLKQVIREELAAELKDLSLAPELVELESRIDGLALLGFDAYTKRREKLCELKVNEVKAKVSGLLRRAGLRLARQSACSRSRCSRRSPMPSSAATSSNSSVAGM
jgi:hypothetical protein